MAEWTRMGNGQARRPADERDRAPNRETLSVERILAWADAYHKMHRSWPLFRGVPLAGQVPGAPRESWRAIDAALAMGLRGLPGHCSLRELLAGRRVTLSSRPAAPPPAAGDPAAGSDFGRLARGTRLRLAQILEWADAHRAATGDWPTPGSGSVGAASFPVTWFALEEALNAGRWGLPYGLTLAHLLGVHRRVVYRHTSRALSIEQILSWADAHHTATGAWPKCSSGGVLHAALPVTWAAIDGALRAGGHGLPGGSKLSRLLAEHRQVRSRLDEVLSTETILAWADAHFETTGEWPHTGTGAVRAAAYRITWSAINYDLSRGKRGLPGGSTLSLLLKNHRRTRRCGSGRTPRLEQILAWADAHHAATGLWPSTGCGRSPADPGGVSWTSLAVAVRAGRCGFPKGTSLWQLLAEHHRSARSLLSVAQIIAWADAHHAATGTWPTAGSGKIAGTTGETWSRVDRALRNGARGLRWRSSLSCLLTDYGRRRKATARGCGETGS
jgi:hypothetical protein